LKGPPTAAEWRFASGFSAERRENLERLASFEDIGHAIVGEAQVTALPMEIARDGELRGCRRPVFRVAVEPATFDQFHNGRDGYRGRFWQSPDVGEQANRWLLKELAPKLGESLGGSPNTEFILKSLSCDSAMVWFHEDSAVGAARLQVAQWEEAARGGSTLSDKARQGRWAPSGTVIEVKGAYLTDSVRERVDPDRVERSMEIHLAGYT
jgi:hypothetical protein